MMFFIKEDRENLSSIRETNIELAQQMDYIRQDINHIKDIYSGINFSEIKIINERLEENTKRLNQMLLEFKGVVSMSRAGISKGKIPPPEVGINIVKGDD